MQAAGMLRGTGAVYLLVLLVPLIGDASSFPLQLLPSIPGYIPVYIRHGDQPLEEINPALAEAFHETPNYSKSIRFDEISEHVEPNPLDEDAQLHVGRSKKKSLYPVHARQVENERSTKSTEDKEEERQRKDTEEPKLLRNHESSKELKGQGQEKDLERRSDSADPVTKDDESNKETHNDIAAETEKKEIDPDLYDVPSSPQEAHHHH